MLKNDSEISIKYKQIDMSLQKGFNDQMIILSQMFYEVSSEDLKDVYHRSIGAITCLNNFLQTYCSTGMLLSKNIVLTAASNICESQGYENKHIRFYLPTNGKSSEYYQVQSIRYPLQFKTGQKQQLQFNYALLKLKDKVSYNQFPKISLSCQSCLKDQNKQKDLQIYGFPIYKHNYQKVDKEGQEIILKQYGLSKKNSITEIDLQKCSIGYSINSSSGNIGSPIMFNKKIIGIHIGSKLKQYSNFGRVIEQSFAASITKMCAQMKGQQFNISKNQMCKHRQQNYLKLLQEKKISKQQRQEKEQTQSTQPYENEIGAISFQKENNYSRIQKNLLQSKWEKLISPSIGFKKEIQCEFQTDKLKLLDLKSEQKFKLTSKDMQTLSKIPLPCLIDLNLDNNQIRDQGLQALCRNNYPQLKTVSLDDNSITINGLRHILFNKWSLKTRYYLFSVQSNDNGYYLHVGDCLPIMKKIFLAQDMNEVDYLIPTEKSKTLNAINLLLLTPLDNKDPKYFAYNSRELQMKYQKQSSKSIYSLATVFIRLKRFLGTSLKFSDKPSIKSKLSSKVILTGLLDERFTFTKKLKNFKDFHFSEFRCNHKRLLSFEAQYMEFLRKTYNVLTTDMSLDKVTEGSIEAISSDSFTHASSLNRSFFQKGIDEVRLFFENLFLTQDQFDSKGDYQFPSLKEANLQGRGGFPYYQPLLGKRFGIKVQNLYKLNGKVNNDWLMMDGNKEEWAVAFHGVIRPQLGNMRSIMNGRVQGIMLKPGYQQNHSSDTCIKNGSTVGEGIQVSPYFFDSLFECSEISKNQKYHLILQCRVKPKSIKIPEKKPNNWVLNNREELRPYGIILFTDKDVEYFRKISPKPEALHKIIFHQEFSVAKWKKTYKKYYESFASKKQ